MALYINSNISSLNAQRHLTGSGRAMSKAFERLSSGFRINSAADDAAGLAISNRMTAQIRSLNTAIRNTNDGVSLVQTAESAMFEMNNILERMRELAVQAANDTNTLSDRQSLQGEIDQLVAELDRIGNNTEYNTQNLLDGTFSAKDIHVGAQADQTIAIELADFRPDALGAVAASTGSEVSSVAISAGDVSINGTVIDATLAADDTLSNTNATFSAIAKAAAINKTSGTHNVTATVEANTYTAGAGSTVQAGNLAAAGLIINGTDIGAVTGIQVNDQGGHLVAAINAKTTSTGVTASVSNGLLTLQAADGRNIDLTFDANAATLSGLNGSSATVVEYSQVTLTSNEDYTVAGAAARIGFAVGDTTVDRTDVVSTLSVVTKLGANSALSTIDKAIDQVSSRRGDLGALQNRFESTIQNLQAVTENLSAARSRIRDADFATETAELTRTQIVQQAGVAILAQANAAPQSVLALLAG